MTDCYWVTHWLAATAQLFKNILPCDEIEGGIAETLGNFIEFTSRIFETAKELETARTLQGWQVTLREVVDRFFDPTEDVEREMLQVRRVIESLEESGAASDFDEIVELDVLLAFLTDAFGSAISGSGFLLGAVTFCALKPMRSIPFKVIAILGIERYGISQEARGDRLRLDRAESAAGRPFGA